MRYLIATILLACVAIPTTARAKGNVSCDNRFLWTCDVRGVSTDKKHKSYRFERAHHRSHVRTRARQHYGRPAGVGSGQGIRQACDGRACGTVVAWAVEKFVSLFRDLRAMGYNIGHPGCYSPTGHMRHSKHHWGGACDLFNQVARDRTALRQPPPGIQIAIASRHGLTSGCSWRSRDCGHFEVKTWNYAKAY